MKNIKRIFTQLDSIPMPDKSKIIPGYEIKSRKTGTFNIYALSVALVIVITAGTISIFAFGNSGNDLPFATFESDTINTNTTTELTTTKIIATESPTTTFITEIPSTKTQPPSTTTHSQQTQPPVITTTSMDNSSSDKITRDKAKTIALERAGGGKVLEIELDNCGGRLVYEVEVKHNGIEYEIVIDAMTGEIIKFKKC